jgi:hypothetical protein
MAKWSLFECGFNQCVFEGRDVETSMRELFSFSRKPLSLAASCSWDSSYIYVELEGDGKRVVTIGKWKMVVDELQNKLNGEVIKELTEVGSRVLIVKTSSNRLVSVNRGNHDGHISSLLIRQLEVINQSEGLIHSTQSGANQLEGINSVHSTHQSEGAIDSVHSTHQSEGAVDSVHSTHQSEGAVELVHSTHQSEGAVESVHSTHQSEGAVDSVHSTRLGAHFVRFDTGQVYRAVLTDSTLEITKPILLGIPMQRVSCGSDHVLLLGNGRVWSCGLNHRGQLGVGDLQSRLEQPVLVEALDGICCRDISCGNWHNLTLSQFGDIYSWGWNADKQLGHSADTATVALPMLVDIGGGDMDFTLVRCGARHSAAVSRCGLLFTWGWNGYQQLGHTDCSPSGSPAHVSTACAEVVWLHCAPWSTLFLTHHKPP